MKPGQKDSEIIEVLWKDYGEHSPEQSAVCRWTHLRKGMGQCPK